VHRESDILAKRQVCSAHSKWMESTTTAHPQHRLSATLPETPNDDSVNGCRGISHQNESKVEPHEDTPPTSPPVVSPPYWRLHNRSASNVSLGGPLPGQITLEDNTETTTDRSGALWAKSVTIEDYVVVKGSRTGVGAYVVWNCIVETLDGGPMRIRKR
jgi:hypothetical protein